MKALLLMVTVTATALVLAATSLAVGEAKNEAPFSRTLNVVQIQQSLKALVSRSEALNQQHHLGSYAATDSTPNYQAVKERI
jgi:hypothetical protein